jgi:periplasmic protein CpxP/Spy
MKSIRKLVAGSLLASGALLAAGAGLSLAAAADDPSTATQPADHGPGHPGFHRDQLFSKLNLTAEQQASIKAIMTAAKPQMKTLHQQMHANHLKLTQTKPDDPNYGNVVAEVAQANATLASQRTTQGAEIKAQIYAVLTPAQKTQLATLQAQREARWEANPHHGHWGHRGPADSQT